MVAVDGFGGWRAEQDRPHAAHYAATERQQLLLGRGQEGGLPTPLTLSFTTTCASLDHRIDHFVD